MRTPRVFKVLNHPKYSYIVIMPVVNSSDWSILIDGKLRFGGLQFSSSEIEEKLTYFGKHLNMVEENLRKHRGKAPI